MSRFAVVADVFDDVGDDPSDEHASDYIVVFRAVALAFGKSSDFPGIWRAFQSIKVVGGVADGAIDACGAKVVFMGDYITIRRVMSLSHSFTLLFL